ncbi:hypothetical protein QOZ80_7BG0600680 [Eleusine coracana subsp. coracana]|nr:hypothetical protein QOZ80_7BG0600680 [Eleusine coracana subsp. coracana]
MKMMAQSAAVRRLRRGLEARRMRGALAPAGAIAKKPSPPPLCSPPAPAGITSASLSFSKGAHVRVRTAVGTMRTGKLLVLWLGAVVVSAAAEEEDGCLGVVYTHYKNPRSSDHPFCTVRVPKNDVKNMPPPLAAAAAATDTAASAGGGCSDVTMSHSALPSLLQGKVDPALRPTVAGKKPALLKKMEGEVRSKSDAILASWR